MKLPKFLSYLVSLCLLLNVTANFSADDFHGGSLSGSIDEDAFTDVIFDLAEFNEHEYTTVKESVLLVGILYSSLSDFCNAKQISDDKIQEWSILYASALANDAEYQQLLKEKMLLVEVSVVLINRLNVQFHKRSFIKSVWDRKAIFAVIGMGVWEFISYLESTMDEDMNWIHFMYGEQSNRCYNCFHSQFSSSTFHLGLLHIEHTPGTGHQLQSHTIRSFDYFKKVVDITGLDLIITPYTNDIWGKKVWLALFTMLYVDFLDTSGTLLGLGMELGINSGIYRRCCSHHGW